MSEVKVIEIKIKDLKKKYAKMRVDHSLNKLSDTSQLKKVRKDIARHYTDYVKQVKALKLTDKKTGEETKTKAKTMAAPQSNSSKGNPS